MLPLFLSHWLLEFSFYYQRLYWFLLSFYIFPHLCFYYRHCLYFFVSHFFRLRRLFLFCLSPSITISLSFSVSLILFYVYLPVFQTLYLLFPPFVDLLVCQSSSSCLLVFLLLPLFPFSISLSLSLSLHLYLILCALQASLFAVVVRKHQNKVISCKAIFSPKHVVISYLNSTLGGGGGREVWSKNSLAGITVECLFRILINSGEFKL